MWRLCYRERHKASQLRVIVGEHNLTMAEGIESTRMIDEIFIHPDYMLRRENDYDIALIKLKGSLEFRHEVAPVCLPETGISNVTECVMTGWRYIHGKCVSPPTHDKCVSPTVMHLVMRTVVMGYLS